MNILNKTVLITGSSQRIGKEIALFFASKNANTIIAYIKMNQIVLLKPLWEMEKLHIVGIKIT